MKPWHKKHQDEYRKLRETVTAEFPDLHVSLEHGRVIIKGSFPLIEKGKLLDRYSILIELPNNYPNSMPIVYEIGGRIPRTKDKHINPDGSACLSIPEEYKPPFPIGSSFVDFLKHYVHDFFLWQNSVEKTGQPVTEAWAHGGEGIVEYYKEEYGIDDLDTIRRLTDYLSRNEVKGHWECYCNSGEKMRKCQDHFDKLIELRGKITREAAEKSQSQIKEYIHKQESKKAQRVPSIGGEQS